MTGEYLASVAPSSSPSGAWEQLRSLRSDPNVTFHQLRAMTHYALQETQTAARIGNLLASFLWEELPDVDRVQRIHITGMATTAPLVAPMRAQLVAAGIAPVFTGQDFGMAVAELMNPSPIDADVVVVLLDEALVTARLPAAWSIEDMRQAIAEATAFVEESLVRVASNAFVVTTTVAVPPLLSRSLVSLADRTQLALLWREFDAAILRLGLGRHSIAVVDLSLTLTGSVPLRDEALHHSAGLAQSLELIDALAQEFSTIVRAHAGLVKKALITDLDNTLWGGILGDDGVDGINSDPVKGLFGHSVGVMG